MPGVRVHHLTVRNARFTVVENDRPYSQPLQCAAPEFGGCGSVHTFKTHHLNVDDTGSVIVGDKLFEKIRELLAANDFVIANEVKRPPTLGIGLGQQVAGAGAWGNIQIIHGQES